MRDLLGKKKSVLFLFVLFSVIVCGDVAMDFFVIFSTTNALNTFFDNNEENKKRSKRIKKKKKEKKELQKQKEEVTVHIDQATLKTAWLYLYIIQFETEPH